MKSLLAIILLTAGAAHAQCVFVPNSIHCVDRNQAYNDQQERQRQQQQIEQMQRQIEQQNRLNQMNAHQAQQPPGFRQQCAINVFGVMECK
jgi:hypothetical protein